MGGIWFWLRKIGDEQLVTVSGCFCFGVFFMDIFPAASTNNASAPRAASPVFRQRQEEIHLPTLPRPLQTHS
jgi:hypothetical protein